MKLSTKSRYAVTAMMELAMRDEQGPVTLSEISAEQGISISYLEQLFARLRTSGLVKGTRGPGGGYRLAQSPHDITIADIITSVDEKAYAGRIEESVYWVDMQGRKTQRMWRELSSRIFDFLNGLTLAEAVAADTGETSEAASEEQLVHGDKAA